MTSFVSIIVPVKAEHKYITECIASLMNLDYPKESYEILVVLDKNATDEVKKALKPYANKVKLLQSKKAGSAANRNLGASKAGSKAKYLAFTDADCVVDKQWLRTLVSRMDVLSKKEKDIGVVGGLNLIPNSDNNFAKTVGAMEQTLLGGGGSVQGSIMSKEQTVASLPNCNAMYKRVLWKENKQDEKLITGQDGEFNYRLGRKGVRFLAIPDAIVWHHRTNTLKGFVRRMFKYGEATARIFRKHRDIDFLRIRWYGLVPVAALLMFIALVVLSLFSLAALYTLAFALGMYAAADIMTAISVVEKTGKAYSVISLLLLPLQHFLYAVGIIKGMVN
jgi:cellulose synthase/poly-beta-1,6-N-acetylglucosamine synthase-like glycosyltransferase